MYREDVVEEIRKTTSCLDGKNTSAEVGASVFEKAKRYAESCLKCNFKTSFIYDLLATNEVEHAVTLENAKDVVQEFQAACKALLRYAINLLHSPQKMEFRRIKLSSRFYVCRISNKMSGAEKVLIHMGYHSTADGQELLYEGDVNKDAIIETVGDLVILFALLELHLKWMQEARGHGNQANLKEIIDYCKAGFTHGQIVKVLTKPSPSTLGNRGDSHMHSTGQHKPPNFIHDTCRYPAVESQNSPEGNSLCGPVNHREPVISKWSGGGLQGNDCPHIENGIFRQRSCPGDECVRRQEEGQKLTRSISLESSIGSQGSGGPLESDHGLVISKVNSTTYAEPMSTPEVDTSVALSEVDPANNIRSFAVASRLECSYCMFLNQASNKYCEICNKEL